MSILDAMFSLTIFSKSQENMCRPRVFSGVKPSMLIENGRHPALSQDTYIPNTCIFGSEVQSENKDSGTFVLLTGPNMGGKSTLMRQIGLISILAHMVPVLDLILSSFLVKLMQ